VAENNSSHDFHVLFPIYCSVCTKLVYEYFYRGRILDFGLQSTLDLTAKGWSYTKNIFICWQMSVLHCVPNKKAVL